MKIRSNQYIQLDYTNSKRKNTCTINKDWFACFSFLDFRDEQDKGKKITHLFLYWFTQSQSYIQFTKTTWANKQQVFESHKNIIPNIVTIPLINLELHLEHYKGIRTKKPDGGSPYPTKHVFFKLQPSQNGSKINQDLQSTIATVWFKEREFSKSVWLFFALRNLNSYLISLKTSLYNLIVIVNEFKKLIYP